MNKEMTGLVGLGNDWISWFRDSLIPVMQNKNWLRQKRLEPLVCSAWQWAYRQDHDYISQRVGSIPEIDSEL